MRFWPGRHPAPCALACIALFGLLLRLRGLNHSMSPDEAGMFDYLIRIGLRVIVFGPYPSGNHVLNTLCTWLAYSLFGLHDWAFQLPSLLFGMGGILLAYPVGTALFGSSKAGLAGALFLACAPYHVAYSANSRGYTAVIFFALLSALFMERNLRRPGAAGFVGLALATFFMGMSQLSSLALLSAWGIAAGASAAWLLLGKERRTRARLFGVVTACAALGAGLVLINLGYSPVFSLYRGIFARVFEGHWTTDVNNFLCGAEQSYWHPFWRFTETNTGLRGGLFWAASLVALAGVALSAARRHWAALLASAGILCPIAVYLVFNLKLEPRYTMIVLPFWVLAFGAGTVCIAAAAGRCASRMPRISGAASHVFQGGVFAGIALAYGIAVLPLYSSTPALACVFSDYKAAARHLAANMGGDDVLAYDPRSHDIVEHYLNRYVFPVLEPSREPSLRSRVWLFTELPGTGEIERLLPGYSLTPVSSFDGCFLWRGEISAPNMHRVELAPFQICGSGCQDRLAPWIMTGMSQDIGITVEDTAEDIPSRCLQVTTATSRPDWRLFCPPQPCPPGRVALFRAEERGIAELWATGVFLRFYDDQHNQIEERVMRVPSKGAPESTWKRLQQTQIAPPKTRYVSGGLWVSQPSRPGRTIAFRNVELWIDGPPAPAASSGT